MSNKSIFRSSTNPSIPVTNTINSAGGTAYEMSAKAALAQLACTNCFNGTYYASATDTLTVAKEAALKLRSDPQFIAKAALYSRTKGYMKDMPAFLAVILAGLDTTLFHQVFPQVIDNGKMLRNFVQIARSGATGRKFNMSAGACRTALGNWFANQSSSGIFRASIGNDPSMKDILAMARPRPNSEEKAALFAYLKGAEFKDGIFRTYKKDIKGRKYVAYQHSFEKLPEIVRQYENYKKNKTGTPPNVDFRLLDSLGIGKEEWTEIARNAGWQMTRMNLNTFARHGVFENLEVTNLIANRIRNKEEIVKANVFPYQLMIAYKATENSSTIPHAVRDALQDAMEIATSNVPSFDGKIYVLVDTSGSMGSPITGNRVGSTSKVTCVEVAGLFAASVLRQNPTAEVVPFDTSVHEVKLNGRDTVMTNAGKLARNGGGTDCSCALRYLNHKNAKGDVVIYVSDNESWVDSHEYGNCGTKTMTEFQAFKRRNPNAKMVCIDLSPNITSQAIERQDILQVGGFSDAVFNVIGSFIKRGHDKNHWVSEIESINIGRGNGNTLDNEEEEG